MRVPAPRHPREDGFTLMEMMVVMILLGIVAGLGFAGFDRMDPGSRGLQVTLESFLEASRDRARASGQEVRVAILPATAESGPRIARYVYRPALEAGFEPAFADSENVRTYGGARLGGPGRSGAGLDLMDGGAAVVEGRGGRVELGEGFALEFDLLLPPGDAGRVCEWEGLFDLECRRNGGMQARLRTGQADFLAWTQLDVPGHLLRAGRWQHLRVAAADGLARLWLDGELAASETIGPELGAPTTPPRFGATEGGFHGRVDEAVVWSRVREDGPELAEQISVTFAGVPALLFDRDGRLAAAAHPEAVRVAILEGEDEIGAFLVGRFTQEAP